MKSFIAFTLFAFTLTACAAAPLPADTDLPDQTEVKIPAQTKAGITPLEDIIAEGDYNNDGPADEPVPGANTDQTIPDDAFLERVENRNTR